MDNNKKPLIVIAGPTAVGKTDISISLAKRLGGEIISGDSMQVYKEMNIGTAKIMPNEMNGVKHHLIDCFSPFHSFNVAEFKNEAKRLIYDITERNSIPILVGGTGFYIDSVVYDTDFNEEEEDGYINELYKISEKEDGADILFNMLMEVDPKSTEIIHKNNIKRVIRALDFYHKNNFPISLHNEVEKAKESPYRLSYFVLTMERKKLYDRIDKRVDIMFDSGLIEEVIKLKKMGVTESLTSMQGIGYKEVLPLIDDDFSISDENIEKAKYDIKLDTRHFAKRQLTWFRRNKDVIWIDKDTFDSEDEMLEEMVKRTNL